MTKAVIGDELWSRIEPLLPKRRRRNRRYAGRKPKLTPELQQRLTQLIASGAFIEVAARYSGITDSTYHRWMARGVREPGSPPPGRSAG